MLNRSLILFVVLLIPVAGFCSYIWNPGVGTVTCNAGGISGVQFTDTQFCVWCATTTMAGQISLSQISCPGMGNTGQCEGLLCAILYP